MQRRLDFIVCVDSGIVSVSVLNLWNRNHKVTMDIVVWGICQSAVKSSVGMGLRVEEDWREPSVA